MMVCPRCNAQLHDTATFCPICGTPAGQNNNIPKPPNNGGYPPNNSTGNNMNNNNKKLIAVMIALVGVLIVIISIIIVKSVFDKGSGMSGGGGGGGSVSIHSTTQPGATYTPVPTAVPTPVPTLAPTPTPQVIYVTPEPAYEVTQGTSYSTYHSSKYGFSCAYPSNFRVYDDGGTLYLYTLRSQDGLAEQKIAAKPIGGETVSSSMNAFIADHPGTITYQTSGSNYYALSIKTGSVEYYKYCKFRNGNMYWFEFMSPYRQHDYYDIVINDVYNSITYDY